MFRLYSVSHPQAYAMTETTKLGRANTVIYLLKNCVVIVFNIFFNIFKMLLGQFFLLYTYISYVYCKLLGLVLKHCTSIGTMNVLRNIYLLCACFHKYIEIFLLVL
jgi:hypothetical protein